MSTERLPPQDGLRYSNLVVLSTYVDGRQSRNHIICKAKCLLCGSIKEYILANLRSGNTTSCGCTTANSPGPRKRQKICTVCGAEYIAGHSSKYCPSCKSSQLKAWSRQQYAKTKAGIIPDRRLRPPVCQSCGGVIQNPGKRSKFCSKCAKARQDERMREYAQIRREKWVPSFLENKHVTEFIWCPKCQTYFCYHRNHITVHNRIGRLLDIICDIDHLEKGLCPVCQIMKEESKKI